MFLFPVIVAVTLLDIETIVFQTLCQALIFDEIHHFKFSAPFGSTRICLLGRCSFELHPSVLRLPLDLSTGYVLICSPTFSLK
jgi:hypothetical protein